MRTAVLTLAHGRHDHLRGQVAGLRTGDLLPDLHVVAAMDDVALVTGVVPGIEGPWQQEVVPVAGQPLGLPLAAARNAAAEAALAAGAELLVFLDVDCIPAPGMLRAYVEALGPDVAVPRPTLWCGPVAYLPARPEGVVDYDLAELEAIAEPRADRPRPEPGEVLPEPDLNRFWSLSFAMTAEDWRTVGGLCTDYVGYGGEDTDLAQLVGRAGGGMAWVGGATAYHQHHPSPSPPLQHLEAIVRNANVFHDRWGRWPMEGWLAAFAERGLAETGPDGRWRVTGR